MIDTSKSIRKVTYEGVEIPLKGSGGEDTLTAFFNNTLETVTDTTDLYPYKFFNKYSIKHIEVNSNVAETANYAFFGCSAIESGTITANLGATGGIGNYGFNSLGRFAEASTLKINANVSITSSFCQYAIFDEANFKSSSTTIKATSARNAFANCTANKLTITNCNTLGPFNSGLYAIGYLSSIGKVYLPDLAVIGSYGVRGLGKIFLKRTSCTLSSAKNDVGATDTIFIPYTAIDNYSQATNWTSLFTNDGADEAKIFVWEEFTSGETLPTQIGTTQVYNVTWYEDDGFTTQASGTATDTKEYYGKISAVV